MISPPLSRSSCSRSSGSGSSGRSITGRTGGPGSPRRRGRCLSWLSIALACTLCLFRHACVGFGIAQAGIHRHHRRSEVADREGAAFPRALPVEFRGGWTLKNHAPHMRLVFPGTGALITGEAGTTSGAAIRRRLSSSMKRRFSSGRDGRGVADADHELQDRHLDAERAWQCVLRSISIILRRCGRRSYSFRLGSGRCRRSPCSWYRADRSSPSSSRRRRRGTRPQRVHRGIRPRGGDGGGVVRRRR